MMTSLLTSSYHIVILIYGARQRNPNQVLLVPSRSQGPWVVKTIDILQVSGGWKAVGRPDVASLRGLTAVPLGPHGFAFSTGTIELVPGGSGTQRAPQSGPCLFFNEFLRWMSFALVPAMTIPALKCKAATGKTQRKEGQTAVLGITRQNLDSLRRDLQV